VPRCLTCGRRWTGAHLGCESPVQPTEQVAPPEAINPAVPGYAVEGTLGRGGFGRVLAARRLSDGAPVALKLALAGSEAARVQLAREAEVLSSVGLPAVVGLLGNGALSDGTPYLALERVELPTLAERLDALSGPMELSETLELTRALASTLATLHAAGWAHCDLKPENVFVARQPPAARLCDLGLARRLGGASSAEASGGGAYAGTPEYMAPEQCEGRLRPDARCDVYAAGVILYEMLTGRPPFFGTAAEVQQAHANRRPAPLSELVPVTPAVEALVLRCLAKERGARIGNGAALLSALEEAFGRREKPARTPTGSLRTVARPPEKRIAAAVFFESSADALTVQAAAVALGGQLAHAAGRCYVVAFDASLHENPVRRALRCASGLVDQQLAERARVDLVTVSVQSSPSGNGARLFCAAFSRKESFPAPEDPAGTSTTARAVELAPDTCCEPLPGRPEILRVLPGRRVVEQATVVRHGAGPLIGRGALVEAVLERAEEAFRSSSSRFVTLVGEPGVGKTRLVAALVDRLRPLPASPQVLELRAREPLAGEEGETFRQLVLWALGIPPAGRPADGGREILRSALPEVDWEAWPPLALALGWIDAGAPELAAKSAAPGALRSLAIRAAGDALRRKARRQPICVLLDDAHLADSAALDALEYAGLAEAAVPLLVCAVGRPSFAVARPSFGERAGASATMPLEPLSPTHAAELCEQLLRPAENVPRATLEKLASRSRGLPAMLVELVRGLERAGLLRRHGEAGAWFLATDELDRLPDLPLVEWLAERELAALPRDLRAHAQLASALGDEFSLREMGGVLAELERAGHGAAFPLDAQVSLQKLLGLGLLVQHRGEGLGFRVPLVREAVTRSMPEELRRAVHEAAFAHYRGPLPMAEGRRLARLAFHAQASGRAEEAGAIHLALAEGLRRRHAYLEAESLFSRALEELPATDSAERLAATRGRGLMRYRVGRSEDSVADLEQAQWIARARGDPLAEAECLLDEATCLDWMSDYPRSAARVAQAETVAASADSPALRAELTLARGRSRFRAGDWAGASGSLEEAVRQAEPLGDAGYETLVIALLLLGTALPHLGRSNEAEAALQRAAGLCQARGDQLHLSAVMGNGRNLRVARGDLDGAVRDQQAAIRIGRELGVAGIEYYAEYNIGELLYQSGDASAAHVHVARAAQIERNHPEVAPVPVALLLWGRLLLFQGDLAGARSRLDTLRAALASTKGQPAPALAPAEEVLAEMVALATGEAGEAEWEALLARSSRDSIEQEPIEVVEMHGLSALRAGRTAEARAALQSALDLAARIPNLMVARIRRELQQL